MASETSRHLFFSCDNVTEADSYVISFKGLEEISRLSEYEIEFYHPKGDLDLHKIVGSSFTIGIHNRKKTKRPIYGIVKEIQLLGRAGEQYETQ